MPDKTENGYPLLHDPHLNKGTAFTESERKGKGLEGLLPTVPNTLEQQTARIHVELSYLDNDLQKYLFLSDLQARNETLFYARGHVRSRDIHADRLHADRGRGLPEVRPHFPRRPRRLCADHRPRPVSPISSVNWPQTDVRFIVVTDGERILGLGDLGIGGMGIPLGKLSLYTACAGVPPQYCLPITLDVGTNNQALLDDPLYLGLRQNRVRGQDYDDFIDEFVQAVQVRYPKCCIQWEDFANQNAVPILARYRDKICTYNDDIQGTAAVALAGIYAALHISGGKLVDQRFLFLGGGSAATGIAELIAQAMALEGLPLQEARKRNALFDINGLMVTSRDDLQPFQKPFALDHAPVDTFVDAVRALKPTGIIGVSTVPKLFNQQVIEAMAEINERPIIFPYSNPTSRSECTAEEAYRWTKGRAIFASGSPFPPVEIEGKTFVPGQGNNVYIFPAMGMAVFATRSEAGHRRDVYHRGEGRRRAGQAKQPRQGPDLSAAEPRFTGIPARCDRISRAISSSRAWPASTGRTTWQPLSEAGSIGPPTQTSRMANDQAADNRQ